MAEAAHTTDANTPMPPGGGLHQESSIAHEAAAMLRLAIPLALTQVGQLAMFTTDLALIGRLGDEYLAAGSLAHTILFAAFVIGMGLMAAVGPLTAQAVGAEDPQMVRRSLRVGLHAAILLGIPMLLVPLYAEDFLVALGQPQAAAAGAATYLLGLSWSAIPAWIFMGLRGYMSALGNANPGLWIMLAGIPANGIIAYLFIFGGFGLPAFGLLGAGIATTLVNFGMCAVAAFVVMRFEPFSVYRPLDRIWKPDWQQFARLILIGAPIAIAFTLEHGLFMASNLMAGTIGLVQIAAHQIALQVASIAFMLPLGLAMAASVRVGHPFGAGRHADAVRAGWVALALGLIVTSAMTAIVVACSSFVPALFLGSRTEANAETYLLADALLWFAAAFFIVDGCQTIAAGVLRGFNDTRVPMLFSFVSFWLVGFPACWWLTYEAGFGVRGVWMGLCIGLAVYAALLCVRFWATHARNPNVN